MQQASHGGDVGRFHIANHAESGIVDQHFDFNAKAFERFDNTLGGMESRIEIHASNTAIRCNLSPHDLVRAYAPDAAVFGHHYLQEKLDSGAGWTTPLPDEDWSSGQLAMCQAFADALCDGTPVETDGQLGLDVTRVVYAAYQSAAEGRRIALD